MTEREGQHPPTHDPAPFSCFADNIDIGARAQETIVRQLNNRPRRLATSALVALLGLGILSGRAGAAAAAGGAPLPRGRAGARLLRHTVEHDAEWPEPWPGRTLPQARAGRARDL